MGKVGFVLAHEQFTSPELVELAVVAEAAGFDRVWTSDHFHPWMDNQGHAGQAWVTLAAVSQRTELSFGTGVTCPTFRYNPAIVAQAFATLSALAPGRVFLGVGTGEALNERPPTGQWPPYPDRAARLVEAIGVIRELWRGGWVTHDGEHFHIVEARLYDPPPAPVPIYVAAEGPKSMRLAGEHGDGLISDAVRVVMPEMREAFEAGARSAGKDPSTMPILAEAFIVVGGDRQRDEALANWRFIAHAWDRYVDWPDPRAIAQDAESSTAEEVTAHWVVSVDPATHAEAISKLFEQGVTEVYIHSGQWDQRAVIDFFGKQVLPLLGRVGAPA
jgi:TAT-translocated FGD2 family F420-dependent dehydrogenase